MPGWAFPPTRPIGSALTAGLDLALKRLAGNHSTNRFISQVDPPGILAASAICHRCVTGRNAQIYFAAAIDFCRIASTVLRSSIGTWPGAELLAPTAKVRAEPKVQPNRRVSDP